jgi:hypothetical protein
MRIHLLVATAFVFLTAPASPPGDGDLGVAGKNGSSSARPLRPATPARQSLREAVTP